MTPRKFVLDTHVFIDAFRNAARNDELQRFHRAFAPYEYLSAVVAQELRSGARTADARQALERHVLAPFERTGRVIVPSTAAWHRSGDVLAEMSRRDGLEIPRVSKSFANDIMLAVSSRESGCVLVTGNAGDFARIARFVPFEFVAPWPWCQ